MAAYHTVFGSLGKYQKGTMEIINDNPKHYVFSNVFEVASKSKPYEKVAVAKNLEYVIEAIRAEGTSPWMACAHDEFAVVMDGEVEIEYVKLEAAESVAPAGKEGTVLVKGEPKGKRMGSVKLKRGHQALLPKNTAYQFRSAKPGVVVLQTCKGDLSVERWAEICQTA